MARYIGVRSGMEEMTSEIRDLLEDLQKMDQRSQKTQGASRITPSVRPRTPRTPGTEHCASLGNPDGASALRLPSGGRVEDGSASHSAGGFSHTRGPEDAATRKDGTRRRATMAVPAVDSGEAVMMTTAATAGSGNRAASAIKLTKYSGVEPLEPYLAQVQLAAWHNQWGPQETAVHVALALEGKALQVLLDLAPTERHDFAALTAALERRFGRRTSTDHMRDQLSGRRRHEGESLGTFAADVRFLAQRGYPLFDANVQEELALHAFMQALTPDRLRQHIKLLAPLSLAEALAEAERAEAVLAPPKAPLHQSRQATVSAGEGEEDDEGVVRQAQPAQAWHRPRQKTSPTKSSTVCYRCGQDGHIARHCPAPTPLQGPPQLAGNGVGAAQ